MSFLLDTVQWTAIMVSFNMLYRSVDLPVFISIYEWKYWFCAFLVWCVGQLAIWRITGILAVLCFVLFFSATLKISLYFRGSFRHSLTAACDELFLSFHSFTSLLCLIVSKLWCDSHRASSRKLEFSLIYYICWW